MNAGSIQHIKFTGPLALAIVSLPFSITICHLALILFGIIWIAEGRWNEKWKTILKNPVVVIFVFFFLLNLLGAIYSADQRIGWFSLEKKISLVTLPVMLASTQLRKEDIRKLLHAFIITCVAATLICLWMALGKAYVGSSTLNFDSYSNASFYSLNPSVSSIWMFISYIELASGIGIHPSYFSLYLIFCVFLLIHFYAESFISLTSVKKTILLSLLGYLSIFILLLSSRIMVFAFFSISLYGLHKFLKSAPRSIYWTGSLVCILLFSGILYLNPVSRFRGYQEIVATYPYLKSGLQTQSTTVRASLWSVSIKSLPEINLFFGVGTGDVNHLISEISTRSNITNVLGTNDPHNQYLQTLLGLGVLGLTTLLICFAWPAYISYQTGNFLYLGFIFLFAILCITETAMELQKGVVFYSLFGSLILFQYNHVQLASLNKADV